MARSYQVTRGDTLVKIARREMGDAGMVSVLADFNGIRDVSHIMVGQQLRVPAPHDLKEPAPPLVGDWPTPPLGFTQLTWAFGDPYPFIHDDGTPDPAWERDHMVSAPLPFSIPVSWSLGRRASRIRCHRRLARLFTTVFEAIVQRGLVDTVQSIGGCYEFRSTRNGVKLSTHSWGIALDLNDLTNPRGGTGDMSPRLVEVFEAYGFTWGGRWTGKDRDPMHFQYCAGY